MKKRGFILLAFYVVFILLFVVTMILKIPSFLALPLFLACLIAMLVYVVAPYIPPAWARKVRQTGKQAKAMVLPNHTLNGKGSPDGSDHWLDLSVQVKPEDEDAFEAKMKCKLSQSVALKEGSEISVFYDPTNKKRVVIAS
ncbi:MAG TPA: hypothetical protein VMT73_05270 [Anaerolineales bacterium]|nr:hypothetical protein [Anaerolineales bacterium]